MLRLCYLLATRCFVIGACHIAYILPTDSDYLIPRFGWSVGAGKRKRNYRLVDISKAQSTSHKVGRLVLLINSSTIDKNIMRHILNAFKPFNFMLNKFAYRQTGYLIM